MVQIRNVPDEMHRELKARAALAGMSVSEYLLGQIRRSLELRHNVSVYAAAYLALAETLEAPLLTSDTRLAEAPHSRVPIDVV